MERFVKIDENFCYDCFTNKLVNKKFKRRLLFKKHNFIPPYDKNFLRYNLKNGRQQLILNVTDNCNFRCEYCVYHDTKLKTNEKKFMSFNTAKLAIDDYIKHSDNCEKRCISFYGGEPLLNFKLIKKCVEYVNSLNILKKVHFLLTTNACLMNDAIAEFLYENRFFVNISLDGPEYIHNRYRKNYDNTKTFDRVVNSTKKLISTNPIYWKNSLNFLGVLAKPIDIYSIDDFFNLLPFNYFLSDLEVTNHMKSILEKSNFQKLHTKTPLNKIHLNRTCTIEKGVLNEIRNIKDVLNNTYSFYLPFSPGRYCLPGLKRIFVSLNGDYYICEKADQDPDKIIGNVNTGIDYKKIDYLQEKVLNFHSENCKSCWAARFCHMCFVTISKFPECCDLFKNSIIFAMRKMLEEDYD